MKTIPSPLEFEMTAMTVFVMFLMLCIGFLAGIIATVGFVAYLETKPTTETPDKKSGPQYMSKIDTPEGIKYHSQRN
jgi:hypothetical protein